MQPIIHNVCDKQDRTDVFEEIDEVRDKLEFADQERRMSRLKNMELQKEINYLKQENEELKETNHSYLESLEFEQQQISFLNSMSLDPNDVNIYNNDLNVQISEYKKLVKKLKLNNINLQKENGKYQVILEELNEEKQKRDEMHINNRLNLENIIKDLEYECDGLREEINRINTINTENALQKHSFLPLTSAKYKETNDYFQIKSRTLKSNDKPLYSEIYDSNNYDDNDDDDNDDDFNIKLSKFEQLIQTLKSQNINLQKENQELNEMNINNTLNLENKIKDLEVEINRINDDNDIINQLQQFGYTENDINKAINTLHNKLDINDIIEVIGDNIDCHCVEYYNEIQTKIAEIDRLKIMNHNHKSIKKALQKQIRLLLRENKELLSIKRENKNYRCISCN